MVLTEQRVRLWLVNVLELPSLNIIVIFGSVSHPLVTVCEVLVASAPF